MEHDHDLPSLPANSPQPIIHIPTARPSPEQTMTGSPLPLSYPRSLSPTRPLTSSTMEKKTLEGSEFLSQKGSTQRDDNTNSELRDSGVTEVPRPPLRAQIDRPFSIRKSTIEDINPRRSRTGLDWIVPETQKRDNSPRELTVGERLAPTLANARLERDKYAAKAKLTGWALNCAIGLQVILGALTTGLSAVTTGKQTSIMTAILGGLATIVASYLARARGSNEPELSITRCKDLEQFIRECEAFQMDRGHILGRDEDRNLEDFRRRFEELLGNANGERKLSPV